MYKLVKESLINNKLYEIGEATSKILPYEKISLPYLFVNIKHIEDDHNYNKFMKFRNKVNLIEKDFQDKLSFIDEDSDYGDYVSVHSTYDFKQLQDFYVKVNLKNLNNTDFKDFTMSVGLEQSISEIKYLINVDEDNDIIVYSNLLTTCPTIDFFNSSEFINAFNQLNEKFKDIANININNINTNINDIINDEINHNFLYYKNWRIDFNKAKHNNLNLLNNHKQYQILSTLKEIYEDSYNTFNNIDYKKVANNFQEFYDGFPNMNYITLDDYIENYGEDENLNILKTIKNEFSSLMKDAIIKFYNKNQKPIEFFTVDAYGDKRFDTRRFNFYNAYLTKNNNLTLYSKRKGIQVSDGSELRVYNPKDIKHKISDNNKIIQNIKNKKYSTSIISIYKYNN